MVIRSDIKEFIEQLQIHVNRSMNYPDEAAELLQIAVQTGLTGEFEELIFWAKFFAGTRQIIRRVGPEADETEKLSSEFKSGLERSVELLKILTGRIDHEAAKKYSEFLILTDMENCTSLMNLLSDLSCIKNWQIDGRQLPYENESTLSVEKENPMASKQISKQQAEKLNVLRVHIRNISALALLFFILFIYIDPPVTILGWIIAGMIAVFLVYIVVQIYNTFRNRKS